MTKILVTIVFYLFSFNLLHSQADSWQIVEPWRFLDMQHEVDGDDGTLSLFNQEYFVYFRSSIEDFDTIVLPFSDEVLSVTLVDNAITAVVNSFGIFKVYVSSIQDIDWQYSGAIPGPGRVYHWKSKIFCIYSISEDFYLSQTIDFEDFEIIKEVNQSIFKVQFSKKHIYILDGKTLQYSLDLATTWKIQEFDHNLASATYDSDSTFLVTGASLDILMVSPTGVEIETTVEESFFFWQQFYNSKVRRTEDGEFLVSTINGLLISKLNGTQWEYFHSKHFAREKLSSTIKAIDGIFVTIGNSGYEKLLIEDRSYVHLNSHSLSNCLTLQKFGDTTYYVSNYIFGGSVMIHKSGDDGLSWHRKNFVIKEHFNLFTFRFKYLTNDKAIYFDPTLLAFFTSIDGGFSWNKMNFTIDLDLLYMDYHEGKIIAANAKKVFVIDLDFAVKQFEFNEIFSNNTYIYRALTHNDNLLITARVANSDSTSVFGFNENGEVIKLSFEQTDTNIVGLVKDEENDAILSTTSGIYEIDMENFEFIKLCDNPNNYRHLYIHNQDSIIFYSDTDTYLRNGLCDFTEESVIKDIQSDYVLGGAQYNTLDEKFQGLLANSAGHIFRNGVPYDKSSYTKVPSIENAEYLQIYPNPGNGYFSTFTDHKCDKILVFDYAGRLVCELEGGQQNYRLDVKEGIYFLHFFNGASLPFGVSKLVVKR